MNNLVNNIYIHYAEDNGTKVENVRFGGEEGKNDVHLCLVIHYDNGVASDEFDVYVRWIDKKGKVIQKRVLTPTGRGNEKKEMQTMSNNTSNHLVNPAAREAMDKFKMEAASEVGVNLKNGYNGELTSRQAGSVGGQMVKKMIEAYENGMK